jgi:hypothetical protein
VPDLRRAGESIGIGSYAASAENASGARRAPSRPARGIFALAAGSVWLMKDLADERVFRVMPAISPRTGPTTAIAKRICL